jgi:plasmid stabilization system protein ParE
MRIEWSEDALADLDRFAEFLHGRYPLLAQRIAGEIIKKTQILAERAQLGRTIGSSAEFRQAVLQVANAKYIFQYRIDDERLVMLRVFHGREARD